MSKAPILKRDVKGTKRYGWRICPYSSNDSSARVPASERAYHPITKGKMKMSIRSGHDGVGWVCEDPNCPYYLGTATTEILIPYTTVEIDRSTGEYTVTPRASRNPICPGTFFWEK